ncbi:MAG: tRNA (guanosine(46)-N7)-methyltransferase TrmB [Gammaproteobacteria bacterium]
MARSSDPSDPALPKGHPRGIRSFVRRQGRLTLGQEHALDEFWPIFGVDIGVPTSSSPLWDLDALFGRRAPRVLEIGFGNGESLAFMAREAPDTDFLGIEVHRPGVGHLLMRMHEMELRNIRVICHDAVPILKNHLRPGSLHGVQIYFPDPWHKKRHQKRRLVQADFMERLAGLVHEGGFAHLATDWEDYARHMLRVMEGSVFWDNAVAPTAFADRPRGRPVTKFEQRGRRLGHGVWDLLYQRNAATARRPEATHP